MEDCKYLKIKDITPYHSDVYDHPDYSYTCIIINREVIPFIHCNKDRCKKYIKNEECFNEDNCRV